MLSDTDVDSWMCAFYQEHTTGSGVRAGHTYLSLKALSALTSEVSLLTELAPVEKDALEVESPDSLMLSGDCLGNT